MTACARARAEVVGSGPGLYSRLVAILKIGLPLIALGMLSALFLVQTDDDLGGEITFSKADLAALGSGLRISNPTFTGTTRNNDAFRFTADVVIPDAAPPTRADIDRLDGRMDLEGGLIVDISSDAGVLDIDGQTLVLDRNVIVETSDGLRVESARMSVDLQSGLLVASGGVRANSAMGQIESQTLRIEPHENEKDARLISFDKGVRLVYDPPARDN
jgi:lipopolysaccharide export system protein LptC